MEDVDKNDLSKTIEGLQKAVWHINRYINVLEKADVSEQQTDEGGVQ